jgi:hypothetical protein
MVTWSNEKKCQLEGSGKVALSWALKDGKNVEKSDVESSQGKDCVSKGFEQRHPEMVSLLGCLEAGVCGRWVGKDQLRSWLP